MLSLLLIALALSVSVLAAPIPRLPAPTGPLAVSKISLNSGTESVLLWYPVEKPGKRASYVSSAVLSKIDPGYYGQSAEAIASWATVATHSSDSAPPRQGRAPVLIFLPGQGIYGFQYTALAEDFASRGYVVAVLDYFSPLAPKRTYNAEDADATTNDMARAGIRVLGTLLADPSWSGHIRPDDIAAAGHSIGGAAAIAICRLDHRFRAAVDLDGAPFGLALQGAVAPVLVLRSKPLYSEADLAKRGRTQAQMNKMGEEAAKTWRDFRQSSANSMVRVLSVRGTGHMSFSDSPFVMPDTITRFGGQIIAPERGQSVISTCAAEFLEDYLGGTLNPRASTHCLKLPEIVVNE